jgi:hypothetical protein
MFSSSVPITSFTAAGVGITPAFTYQYGCNCTLKRDECKVRHFAQGAALMDIYMDAHIS